MQKTTFMIINPASSHGKTGRRWPGIRKQLLAEGLSFEHMLTGGPGDATILCRDALRQGYELIVSVGGDGTLNEVVNGFFMVDGEARQKAALGIISTGTGGDFIRTVGLPRGVAGAAARILAGRLQSLDIGQITYRQHNGEMVRRYFCNIADVGLGGFLVGRTRSDAKFLGGRLYFLLATIIALLLYKNGEISILIDDSYRWQGKVVTLVAGNGQYFGGGMRITPLASLDDGLLDILLIKDISKIKLLGNLHRVYRGRHLQIDGVELLRGKKIHVESPSDILLEMDGEQPGKAPVTIELLPRSLNFIV